MDNSSLTLSLASLWEMKHENSIADDPPVLLKAIRWLCQYLPTDPKVYDTLMESKEGMGVKFPYKQDDAVTFDSALEILHYVVRMYGVNRFLLNK
jgi:hypothetical protein